VTKKKYIYIRKQPSNYDYWLFVLANEKDVEAFLARGNERQIKSLRSVLLCLKNQNNEKYLKLNGEEISKRVEVAHAKFD